MDGWLDLGADHASLFERMMCVAGGQWALGSGQCSSWMLAVTALLGCLEVGTSRASRR